MRPGTAEEITVDFDHHRPTFAVNPDHVDAELRHTCPVAWTEAHGGFWVLSRYEDVEALIRNSGAFSTSGGNTIPAPPYASAIMINSDPPVHTKWRRAMNETVSRAIVMNKLQTRVDYWTDLFIDRVIEKGRGDFVYDIAVPIPTAVAMEWLGWDSIDEWWEFGLAWHDLMAAHLGTERYNRASELIMKFDEAIARHVVARRAQPRDDTISHIANLTFDGEQPTVEDCVGLIRILVGAGVDTTTSLISSAIVHLHFYPEDRLKLVENPEMWPLATEEFLRRYPPIRSLVRICTKETEIAGHAIRPGERVLSLVSSANQDMREFSQPLDFNPKRMPNKHLSFGAGIHQCLGMHLARAEFQTVMKRLIQRMPDLTVLDEGLLPYTRQSTVSGWAAVPISFTHGERLMPEDKTAETYEGRH